MTTDVVPMRRVCIAVCTFKRADLLMTLLRSVAAARLTSGHAVLDEVLIVDNDPAESARRTVELARSELGLPLRYVGEPVRGLVAARGRALREAASAELLIFLDDDEHVDADWFDALVGTLTATGAQFAIGPVRPEFPAGTSPVFSRSGLFHREEFPDRSPMVTGNTGNCCIDLTWLRQQGVTFRSEFNRSGGEDAAFFAEVIQRGGRGCYAAHALVHEPVPRSRLSLAWLLRRRLRFGATAVIQRITLERMGMMGRCLCLVEGVARTLLGVVLVLAALPVAPHRALKYAAATARGLGYCLGSLGVNVREY